VNEILFAYVRMKPNTRFEKEAPGVSEVACSIAGAIFSQVSQSRHDFCKYAQEKKPILTT